MSRFYVGQRVRIKWSDNWPWLAGMTGTITGTADLSRKHEPGCEWNVTPDGYASNRLPLDNSKTGFDLFAPNSEQLEPATDYYDLSTWDKCVWQPDHLRANA